MTNYSLAALASRSMDTGVLWTNFGEVLRTIDNNVDSQILDKILKSSNMRPRFRLFVLNDDETVNYEIPQDDIILDSGSFNENYQNGQRKSVTINLSNIDKRYTPDINSIWVHTKFRFDIGVENNGEVIWFPRGIYILSNPSTVHNDSDKQVALSLLDKFAIFEGKRGTLETTYEIPVGANIEEAIIGILTLDDGSGRPLDLQPIIYDSAFKGKVTPYTISKDAGGTLGEILLEIGVVLNAEIYYNSQGNLCVISINETAFDSQKASLWDYSEVKPEYFNSTANYDFENVVNEVHVVGDNINNELFYAIAKNDNPTSPLCLQRIGRRVEYINDTNISSDQLAQDRANYELRKFGILNTTVDLNVSFNPLLFVNNLITVEDDYYNWKRDNFLLQSISYPIGTNSQMSLTCSNVNDYSSEFNLIPTIKNNLTKSISLKWSCFGSNRYGGLVVTLSSSGLKYQTIYLDTPNQEEWIQTLDFNLSLKQGLNNIGVGVNSPNSVIKKATLNITDSNGFINENIVVENIEIQGDITSFMMSNDFNVDDNIGDILIDILIESEYKNVVNYSAQSVLYTDELLIHQQN